MKQITESYVSFETAQLLKEKGFDEKCIGFYTCTEKPYFMEASYRNNWTYEKHGSINAPTHQMVLKWLREEKKIFIGITSYDGQPERLCLEVFHNGERLLYIDSPQKYEELVEGAIEIALKKLV